MRALGAALDEPVFDWFLRLLSGIVVLTACYATYQTHGATILLPVLLLHLVLLLGLRRAQPLAAPSPTGWLGLAAILGMGTIVFVGQYSLVYEPGAPFLQTPFQDYVFYSRLTMPLNRMGMETNSLEMLFPQFQTEQPYHYLDAWFNALLVRLTGLPSVWVFFLSAASVLITGAGTGFVALYRLCGVSLRGAITLGLVTLTVTGTAWTMLMQHSFFANGALLSNVLLLSNPKLAPVYLFLLLAGGLLLQSRFMAASLALAALPLVSVATAPAVGLGLAGLAAYLFWSRKLTFFAALKLLVPMLAGMAYLTLFYSLQPQPYDFAAAGRTATLASVLPAISEIRLLMNIAIGVMLNYAASYVGYLILLVGLLLTRGHLFTVSEGIQPVLAWFGATLLGSVLMRTVGHHYLDGYQFFSNTMVPLTAVVLAVLLGRSVKGTAGKWVALCLGGLIALALANDRSLTFKNTRFSPQFLQQVGPVLEKLPNRGGFLMADADYQIAYMLSADSYTSGTYVSNFKNDYLLLSLSALVPRYFTTDPRFARDSVQAKQITQKTTLYRLAKLQELAGHPIAPESLPLALVRRAGLAFICASRRAVLPAALRPLVRSSYRDAYSGEVLYVLRPQPPTGPVPAL